MKHNRRHLWLLVIVFAAAVLIGLGTLSLYVRDLPPPQAQPVIRAEKKRSRPKPPARPSKVEVNAPDDSSHRFDSQFGTAMDRLNHAFQNHPGRDVEEMIAKVNGSTPAGQPPPCPLSWRDNAATLEMKSDQLAKLSPTKSIMTCADAIEQLPAGTSE